MYPKTCSISSNHGGMEAFAPGTRLVLPGHSHSKNRAGTAPLTDALRGKRRLLLFFSGHWCAPCRAFMPKLMEAYNGYRSNDLEIIFVSHDRDEEAARAYHAQMPWPALAYGDEQRDAIKRIFGVKSVPSLIAVDENGRAVQLPNGETARSLVEVRWGGCDTVQPSDRGS